MDMVKKKYAAAFLPALFLVAMAGAARAESCTIESPNGRLVVAVSDEGGLNYAVELDGKPVLVPSALGLAFKSGTELGPETRIGKVTQSSVESSWNNPFGNRKTAPDIYTESRITLVQSDRKSFGLEVRLYDNGVAFRYVIPEESGMKEFCVVSERTTFRFAGKGQCRLGSPSACAESFYRETTLGELDPGEQGVLPLLVETPAAWAAVAESDVRDWPGMFLQGDGKDGVRAVLADREDGQGKVLSETPRRSSWRVIMISEQAAGLVANDLVATLAAPSAVEDVSWIKPGACAWDSWWHGVNENDPAHKGLDARGTTKSHKKYIDLASEMGWPYQLLDWYWYKNMTTFMKALHSPPNEQPGDFESPVPEVDLNELVQYAKSKNVRLLIWAHSLDLETFGVEKAMDYFAGLGFAGVKIDFLNSQSQETVQWCERVLAAAARRKLTVDFHGMYHPTGLSRTWPNLVTQEGVYGNEYNKMGRAVTPAHQLDLVFTRALLGPMDYTPGGFLNRWPQEFKMTFPTQVQGSRARELALPVLYLSPLTVFCDHPDNYRNQPGIDFYRNMPTTWDETVVLSAAVGGHVALAREKDGVWYIAAINQDEPLELKLPLAFVGGGTWDVRAYSDSNDPDAPATVVKESHSSVKASDELEISLAAGGGFAAILKPAN